MTLRPRTVLLAVAGWGCAAAPGRAAIPMAQASVAVSVTVVPGCNNTACQAVPHVLHYGSSDGGNGQPPFDLAAVSGRPLLTITY